MQDSAPETGTRTGARKKVYATFATYSPDAKQVVASFYDDLVHVFDLPNHHQPVVCRSPFMSRSQHRRAVFHFMQEATEHTLASENTEALGRTNRVLELEPDHVLALLLRAEAFVRRNSFGDLRSGFATLCRLCKLLQKDSSRIAELFGTHTPDGDLCLPPDSPACAERTEVWLKVLQYRQASILFRLTPAHHIRMVLPGTASSNITKKRLEHLDSMTAQIGKFLEFRLHPTNQKLASDKAFGNQAEQNRLFATPASKMRGEVLHRVFECFFQGLPALRTEIQNGLSHLRDHNNDNLEFPCDSDNTYTSDSEDDVVEEKLEIVGDLEKLQKEDFNPSDVETSSLWGPPPADQQGWRSYYGHTSTQTDIKEARFYGSQNQVVLSGSDDGNVYMWAARTGELLRKIPGDDHIVNCVLPHPTRSMIISSGIDSTIKVIAPEGDP